MNQKMTADENGGRNSTGKQIPFATTQHRFAPKCFSTVTREPQPPVFVVKVLARRASIAPFRLADHQSFDRIF
jgi:hypothetical protein